MTLYNASEAAYKAHMPLVAFKLSDTQLAALDDAARKASNTRSGIIRLALDRFLGTQTASAPTRAPLERPRHAANCRCAACVGK